MSAPGFFTIGHSNRSLAEFLDIVGPAGVQFVADVRRFPRSRGNPDFNVDTLPDALRAAGIGYRHFEALGGRRGRQRDIPETLNAFWKNESFHNYADYAQGDAFGRALAELCTLGQGARVAIMCAEAVWWRCHRRIIADYLLMQGHGVAHLMGPGRAEDARPTRTAHLAEGGRIVYPATPSRPPE